MKQRQLDRAEKFLEKQQQALQKEIVALERRLADLKQKQSLLRDSSRRCDTELGQRTGALVCWNRNDFSALLNQISQLVDQRIQEHQKQLATLAHSLQQKQLTRQGVEHLLTREVKKVAGVEARNGQQEFEEALVI
ncbi:MAG: hypothetical protein ACPG5T_07250, partial [Endozoicomonas sp.]